MSNQITSSAEDTREGINPPFDRGFRGSPPSFFFYFWCFKVRFNGDFYAFGTRFQSFWSQSFARKDISCHARNRMPPGQNCFQTVTIFFYFFSTACFFDIISPMSPQILESTFSTNPWWSFKELCFRKSYTLSLFNYM